MRLFLVEMGGAGAHAPRTGLFRHPEQGYCWLP
jgi:hypothetical protein